MLLFGVNITAQAQWDTGGNNFTAGGCEKAKFGTTDNTCDVQFISNGIERMRLTKDGYFGIGTSTPLRPLHVNGNIRFENLPSELRTTAVMMDANGDLSTRSLPIANWNTAFSWGDHAGLYRPVSWVPDWIDITNKPAFASVATSGSYTDLSDTPVFDSTNWNTAYSWGNHASAGYLTSETDPVWISDSANYYTKSMLQTPGQAQVHYDNLIDPPAIPADISDLSDNSNLLFDGNWSSLTGTAPPISTFTNDAGYITSPDDADSDPTNELQNLSLTVNTLELENGGSIQLGDLNYWTKTQDDELYYQDGYVGIGINDPQHSLHIHSDNRTPIGDEEDGGSLEISTRTGSLQMTTAATNLQLTNAESGTSANDGLQLRLYNTNATLHNKESGSFTLLNNGLHLRLEQNGDLTVGDQQESHMSINTDGKIGIGTVPGNGKFRIKATPEDNYIAQFLYIDENTDNRPRLEIKGGNENNHGIIRLSTTYNTGGAHLALGTHSQPDALYINEAGNVGIGTTYPDKALTVNGSIKCKEVEITDNVPSSDYVFEEEYDLMSVREVEAFITQHKHLPDVPSADEFKKNGYKAGDMDDMLLKKIEELTLYIIEQEKRIEELEGKICEENIRKL